MSTLWPISRGGPRDGLGHTRRVISTGALVLAFARKHEGEAEKSSMKPGLSSLKFI